MKLGMLMLAIPKETKKTFGEFYWGGKKFFSSGISFSDHGFTYLSQQELLFEKKSQEYVS